MHFGERIRELREEKQLLQRQLAASLEIDTPMYSKIERGDRKAKREQVELLADLLETERKPLLTLWLAEQILELVASDELALDAVQIAERQLKELNKK
ncbi:helix-turn-helix domain-containing protein [Aequorivita nionensis]|jgi:transcriptional regulator with XRE-family HTH domain|uniref:helix-turn-helix domain-containing protein n=1 Tax=Aequorivita nionensis TaxID=1287690 RepID=UPI003965B27C